MAQISVYWWRFCAPAPFSETTKHYAPVCDDGHERSVLTKLQTDVAVVGLGAMGSAALWRLAERGVAAMGFERFAPGHDRGSSHGESRIFRTAYLEGPGYVPLAQRAVHLWRELERVTGADLVIQNGALTLGARDSSAITATMRSIRVYDLEHELLDEDELRARYPAHCIAAGEVGIREAQGGLVRPEWGVLAAVARAEELGARVHSRIKIDRIELEPDGVQLIAEDLTCKARHAVISVGSWLGGLLPELGVPLRVTRQIPGWYPIEHPELFAPERFPVFIRDLGGIAGLSGSVADDSSFYGFPTLDGKTIKASIHREGPLTAPDKLDLTVTPEDIAQVKECIELFLNGVASEPVQTQVCMYTNTPDHDFLIGSPAGMPQLTVLGGFSGHGFKFAPVIGDVAADLATHGETDQPVGFLSPNRFLENAAVS